MANTYFEFQQFKVQQELCAMKVCTDACLFGAWVADWLNHSDLSVTQIADIGAGTGLLSLMLAQNSNAVIDAVEIDEGAAKQANENFKQSKWSNRLTLFHAPIQTIVSNKQYDLIISNPPFYEDDLKSSNTARNVALHSQALKLDELLLAIQQLLAAKGHFAILLPYSRAGQFIEMANKLGFYIEKEANVQQTEKHGFFRSMLLFSLNELKPTSETILIKNNQTYSDAFRNLLSPFYLPF